MKVALIKPPATYSDWYKCPAFNLACISTYIRHHGFDCKTFDACFYSWSEKELLRQVREYNPDVIGISAMTHEINQASKITSRLKSQIDAPVVIGGCHVTALPGDTLAEFDTFDYAVYGEGEVTSLELLRAIGEGKLSSLYSIEGLAFRDKGKIVVNAPRPFLTAQELDSLPMPDYHDYYGDSARALAEENKSYLVFSSRGCANRCVFCMRVLGGKIRRRSQENIWTEIEYAMTQYGAHTFDFSDEVFLTDCKETHQLLQLMIERGFPKKARWSANTRANQVNPDIIALAKRSGCYRLGLGVESGDDHILKAISKGITVEQARMAVKIIKDAGIRLGTYFILGHPNETKETLQKTVNLAIELNADTVAVGLMVPYPGTKIYDMARRGEGGYRLLTKDWSQYDKYCAKVLELRDLSHKELVKWQRRILIGLYLKNLRFRDAIKYFWKRKRALIFLLKKKIGLDSLED